MREFCRIVDRVLRKLPDEFRERLENVTIDVMDRPDAKTLQEEGLKPEEWHQILGEFQGQSLIEQHSNETYPNQIRLYKQSIERASRSRDEIAYEIRRTLLHELAHHFGYSEEDLEAFESMPSPFDEAE
jgi:predicted Zn-dependent protease with MMP-like domain